MEFAELAEWAMFAETVSRCIACWVASTTK